MRQQSKIGRACTGLLVGLAALITTGYASATTCVNQVPVATGANAQITASGYYTPDAMPWQAFDASASSMWISAVWGTPAWIAYQFDQAKTISRYSISYANGFNTRAPKDWELQGSNGVDWVTLDKRSNETNWAGTDKRSYVISKPGAYTKYRLYVTDDNDDRAGVVVISISNLSLETCACESVTEQVPVATGDSPAIFSSGSYTSDAPAWKAFDASPSSMWISPVWQTPAQIGYEWTTPRRIESYSLGYANGFNTRAPKDWSLQGWNGTSWVDVDTRTNQTNWLGTETRNFTVAAPGNYNKYRLNVLDDNDVRAGVVVISLSNFSMRGCAADVAINPAALSGKWHQDYTQSSATFDYYVPTSIALEPARFRNAINIYPNGVAEVRRLAPNDAHYFVTGTWKLAGNVLTVSYTDNKFSSTSGSFVINYEVLDASTNRLILRRK